VKIFNIFPGIAKEKMQINKTQRMFRARCLLRISFLSIFLKNIPKSKGKAARKSGRDQSDNKNVKAKFFFTLKKKPNRKEEDQKILRWR
jgi:hypothetical protein